MHPPKGLDHFTMLSLADKAMYKVKESGKQSYCFFDEKMSEEFYKKTEIMNKINNALHTDEFFLEYQPICDGAGNILSCEVLSRWKNDGKYISPIYFIPILEEKGLIGEFTYKVIENVYRDLSADLPISCASVNLSILQFYDEDLISFLEKKAKEFPNIAPRIGFEITENVFSRDPDIVRKKLTSIKALGHKIYLDDFGTGYSSFGYIHDFPVDLLKIDKVFVDDIIDDQKQYKLLKGMISFGNSLEMDIIVEGIEYEKQVEYISKFGINVKFQGYYFYKPMKKERLMALLQG